MSEEGEGALHKGEEAPGERKRIEAPPGGRHLKIATSAGVRSLIPRTDDFGKKGKKSLRGRTKEIGHTGWEKARSPHFACKRKKGAIPRG